MSMRADRRGWITGVMLAGVVGASGTTGVVSAQDDRPLMKLLPRFASASVPKMAPEETETPATTWPPTKGTGLPGKGMGQHPMLYIGEGLNKIFLINDGKIAWTYSTGPGWEYDDVWMLSNGNILFTRMQYIAMVTPEKKVVWRYDAPEGAEIHGCQPIGLDKVLFIQNGLPPKLMVVDIKTKAVEVEHALPAPSLTDQKTVHAQFRRVRYTAQGTYLVPFLTMHRVVEYDKAFNEIWSYDIPTPWAAIRLKNGNTLITDERNVTTREVTPDKRTVWEITPADLPAEFRYRNSQSATRLSNGNTILCSRGGGVQGPQLVEVTPDKKVVWVLQDWEHVGPATAVQILDEPGRPEVPGESEH
jgi:Mala s 1-like protein